MSDIDDRRLRDEIRSWTRRPAASPPAAARRKVLDEIGAARGVGGRRLAAAAALGIALFVGLWLVERPASPPAPAVPEVEEPGPGVLVHELSSGTRVYFAVNSTLPNQPGRIAREGGAL